MEAAASSMISRLKARNTIVATSFAGHEESSDDSSSPRSSLGSVSPRALGTGTLSNFLMTPATTRSVRTRSMPRPPSHRSPSSKKPSPRQKKRGSPREQAQPPAVRRTSFGRPRNWGTPDESSNFFFQDIDEDVVVETTSLEAAALGPTLLRDAEMPVTVPGANLLPEASGCRASTARGTFRQKCFESLRLPEPSTTEQLKSTAAEVDFSNRLLGDAHVAPMCASLLAMRDSLTSINLTRNRLTDQTASLVVHALLQPGSQLRRLDLSQNRLGKAFVDALSCQLGDCKLSELRIRDCKIKESHSFQLLRDLENARFLSLLDLSGNAVGDTSGNLVGELVRLVSLSLRDCRIRSPGFMGLVESLQQNSRLTFLDISMNSMGRGLAVDTTISQLAVALETNTTLRHLNLEDNLITNREHCSTIADALRSNHSIFGLHAGGNNAMSVDALGFVHYIEETGAFMRNQERKGACWICDRWIENVFTFHSDVQKGAPSIHLNFDNPPYQANAMHASGSNLYSLKRVCPPGETVFFFSVGGCQPCVDPTNPLAKRDLTTSLVSDDGQATPVTMRGNGLLFKAGSTSSESKFEGCLPRPAQQIPGAPPPARAAWSLDHSLLKTYAFTSSSRKAFRRDRMMKGLDTFRKVIRHDRLCEDICDLCSEHHHIISDVFRWLAAKTYGAGCVISFSVDMASFLDFVEDVDIAGDLPHSFVTIAYTAALNILPGKPRDGNNSPKSLVRAELIEALLRLAQARVSNAALDMETALLETFRDILVQNIIPKAQRFNAREFVTKRLYNQEAEDVWLDNLQELHNAYDVCSGALATPSEEHTMSLDEFADLMLAVTQRPEFSSGNAITQRETTLAFVLSKMPETDREEKSNRDDPTKLRFVEFLVAIALIAEFNGNPGGIDAFLHVNPSDSDLAMFAALPPMLANLKQMVASIGQITAKKKKKKKR